MASDRAAFVCALALLGFPARGEDRKAARVYTNEDLDRVSARRGETGVLSRPGPSARPRESPPSAPRGRGEEYWRREAARVRSQVRAVQEQAARLRESVERSASRSSTGKGQRARARDRWDAEDARARRIRDLETRARELEADLDDRARREGVPPGWIR